MNSDTWFWFFSSIAQTFATLVALVAIFIISRLELYDVKLNNSKETIRNFIKSTILEEKQDLVEYDGWLQENINRILFTPEPTYREKIIKIEYKKIESLKVKKENAKNKCGCCSNTP